MNTVEKWITTATIHDEHRRKIWSVVFPGATVPIKSILPVRVNVPGHKEADAYMLDLDALTPAQIEGLITTIVEQFNLPYADVSEDIRRGVPILAEGVSVASADQGLVFSMMDGEEEE